MITQVAWLEKQIQQSKADLGADAPIVKALQRQLDGYRSMEVNHEQNFLVGTVPKMADQPLEP